MFRQNVYLIAALISQLALSTGDVLAASADASQYPNKPLRFIVPFAARWAHASSEQGSRLRDANARESCAAAGVRTATSNATQYPSRPIRFIVPFAAGGGTDFVTRLFSQKLGESWSQQVVVDNRPGAAAIIGSDIVAKSTPDGYTLLMGTSSHNVNPSLYRKLPYDTVRDFAPVTLIAQVPTVMSVHPSLAVGNVKDLVAMAKAKPGQLSYASFGFGGSSHLAGELLKATAGVNIVHVPYKGAGDAMSNLLAGQVQIMFSSPASVVPMFKAGKLKGLAVTGTKRPAAAPEIPTFAESGLPAVEVSEWYGVLVPAGTPQPVIAKLNAEIIRILRTPEVSERMASAQFADAVGSTPAQFSEFINTEIARWKKVITEANIRIE